MQGGVLGELIRRRRIRERILGSAFPKQRAFIEDPSTLKAALCTRRAGKSEGAAFALYEKAFANPDSRCLYLALTRLQAKDIMWGKLKDINSERRLCLGVPKRGFNETELKITLPNRSTIKLSGADADSSEREKVLGQSYDLIILDECASFRSDLRALVDSHLGPATVDRRGTIALIGTPGDFIGPPDERHLFYSVTMGEEPGWESVHKWSAFDNPHVAANWAEKIAQIEKTKPLYKETAQYKNMYLGEWAIDESRRVYSVPEDRCLVKAADVPVSVVVQVIGLDLGFNDATSFTVVGWAPNDKTLYVLNSYKRTRWIFSQVAEELIRLQKLYPDAQIVVDGANKQGVEELSKRWGIRLIVTEKTAKRDFIRQMNSDFITGCIKIVSEDCEPLLQEYSQLVWDERSKSPREKDSCQNHCADSALYAWRYARPYLEGPIVVDEFIDPHGVKAVEEFWKRREQAQMLEAGMGVF